MKIKLILKPCPWCRKTPDLWMPIEEDTWLWEIRCKNRECQMNPTSPHVSFRKTTKTNFFQFRDKVAKLANSWNHNNPMMAYEAKLIDLTPLPELSASASMETTRMTLT